MSPTTSSAAKPAAYPTTTTRGTTNFGQSLGSGAWASSAESPHANVPEPSTLALLLLDAIALILLPRLRVVAENRC